MKANIQPIYPYANLDLPPGKPILVDLGCGARKKDGYIGLDFGWYPGVDVKIDLSQHQMPFNNDSVDEMRAVHLLEYLDGWGRIFLLDECWRVLRVGCKLVVTFFYATSRQALSDPFYKFPLLTEFSFDYFKKAWREQNGFLSYGIKSDFDSSYALELEESVRVGRSTDFQRFATKHYCHSIIRMHVTLVKRSDQG